MNSDIKDYNEKLSPEEVTICHTLANAIDAGLKEAESKIWHGHPVWFINQNPIVGYSKQKNGVRLMFWSGADFSEEKLNVRGAKFKDASIFFTTPSQIDPEDLNRWLTISKKFNGTIKISSETKDALINWRYKPHKLKVWYSPNGQKIIEIAGG